MRTLPFSIVPDHPAYDGHFPGMPITPGVVLLDEAMHGIAEAEHRVLQRCKINNAKFLKPVLPGTPLMLHYDCRPNRNINFEIRDHEDAIVATGSFIPQH